MGNNKSSTKLDVLRSSKLVQWIKEGTTGYCDIVRNVENGVQAQQYSVPMDGRLSHEENISRYQYRCTNNQYIVEVYQVERENSQHICQGQDFIKVRTERIPQRLSQLGKVTVEEGLYILSQALNGFKIIYQLHGMAQVNDDMICVTPDGRVKVWLNQNLAKNLPDSEARTIHQNEMVMVDQITDIVKEHIHGNSFPHRYKDMLSQNPSNTFDEALNQLNIYLSTSRTILPKAIRSVRLLTAIGTQQPNTTLINNPQISVIKQKQTTVGNPSKHHHSISGQQPPQILRPNQYQTMNMPRAQTVYSKQTVPLPSEAGRSSINSNIPYNPTHSINNTSTANQSINIQQQSQSIQKSSNIFPQQNMIRHLGQHQQANQQNPPSYSHNSHVSRVDQLEDYINNSQTGVSAKLTMSGHYNTHSLSQLHEQARVPTAKIESSNANLKQSIHNQSQMRVQQLIGKQSTSNLSRQQREVPRLEARQLQEDNTFARENSLQAQLEKLKEVTKLTNNKSQSDIKVGNSIDSQSVCFISPPTETKHIKFEPQPIKEKEKIFIKASNLMATQPSNTAFQKKQFGLPSRQAQTKTNLTGSTNKSQNISFTKSLRSPSTLPSGTVNSSGQQKNIPRHAELQPNINKWTAPRQATMMEAVQVNSTNKGTNKSYSLSTKKPDHLRTDSSVHMPMQRKSDINRQNNEPQIFVSMAQTSEVEQLDALQNRLSEIVNKTRAFTSTNQRTEQSDSKPTKQTH